MSAGNAADEIKHLPKSRMFASPVDYVREPLHLVNQDDFPQNGPKIEEYWFKIGTLNQSRVIIQT